MFAPIPALARFAASPAAPIYLVLAGLAALYAPAFIEFSQGPWRRPENGHAPFIIAIIIAALAAKAPGLAPAARISRATAAASPVLLAVGFGLYAVGRAAGADLFASGSIPIVFAASLALVGGFALVRALWFPIAMSGYLVIIPGWAIGAATAPLKTLISELVAGGLAALGLPIAHAGAVISAGPYQLLVAEACSGVNSLIALTSVGAAYLFMARKADPRTALIVGALLLPIAIVANIARVAILVLITYFFGYDAGQGFLHEGAGLLMFGAALALVFLVDAAAAGFRKRGP
jgi:exosortase